MILRLASGEPDGGGANRLSWGAKVRLAMRDLRIQRKLSLLLVAASVASLLLASISQFAFQWWSVHRAIVREMRGQGEVLAAGVAAAAESRGAEAAGQVLQSLADHPEVAGAEFRWPTGEILARYGKGAAGAPAPTWKPGETERFEIWGREVALWKPVAFRDGRIGSLHLRVDRRVMERELFGPFLLILAGTFLVVLPLAVLLASALHPVISTRLLRLAEMARTVAANKDYSVRAESQGTDEVGQLTDAFNRMLAQIQHRAEALNRSQEKLEALVHSISGIVWECSPGDLRFSFVSRQSDRLLGYRAEDWVERTDFWKKHVHPDDVAEAGETRRRLVTAREPYQFEYRMLAADGRTVWIRESGVVLQDGEGRWVVRGMFLDVTSQNAAAAEMERLNRQLVEASRHAGMAEVATGVLHNVGNVLNSVNVSADLIIDRLGESKVSSLPKVVSLLEENAGDLAGFLATDPRGRRLTEYLGALSRNLADERLLVLRELTSLRKNVDHIKEIVSMQQNYARVFGIIEVVSPLQMADDALELNAGGLHRHGIRVNREFDEVPDVAVEKHKVLQILVNLIHNAIHALDEGRPPHKRLRLRVVAPDDATVRIEVIDNGMGISPENLTRIFQHGFTTRKDGHGFGLHSGAIAARELGGSLIASSDGPGAGATFALVLPRAPVSETRPSASGGPVATQIPPPPRRFLGRGAE